jgi:hypothetical protein
MASVDILGGQIVTIVHYQRYILYVPRAEFVLFLVCFSYFEKKNESRLVLSPCPTPINV